MFAKSFQSVAPRRKKLLAGLVVLLIAAGGLKLWNYYWVSERPAWFGIDFAAMEEVQLLQEYVAIDTTSGNEAAGAEWLAGILRQHGIEPHVERLASGQANLWAVIEGQRPEALVLHHHIDVFPVVEENWSTPPFEATILGGLLHGRGVFDMKSYGVAQLLAFLDVAASGAKPEYSLILLATADEETGARLGTKWFLREHPELAERFWAVITEGGVTESFKEGVVRYWGVEIGQMQGIQITACAPTRQRLEDFAADVAMLSPFPVDIGPGLAETMKSLADTRHHPREERILRTPERLGRDQRKVDDLPAFLRLLSADQWESAEPEAAPNGYRMRMALLRQPGQDPEESPTEAVRAALPEALLTGVRLSIEGHPGPPSTSTDHAVFEVLSARLEARGGDSGPYLLGYIGTDARDFRAHGIPTFGYAPFAFVAAGIGPKDRPNERILLTSYVDGVAEYRAAVKEIIGTAG